MFRADQITEFYMEHIPKVSFQVTLEFHVIEIKAKCSVDWYHNTKTISIKTSIGKHSKTLFQFPRPIIFECLFNLKFLGCKNDQQSSTWEFPGHGHPSLYTNLSGAKGLEFAGWWNKHVLHTKHIFPFRMISMISMLREFILTWWRCFFCWFAFVEGTKRKISTWNMHRFFPTEKGNHVT